MLAGSVALIGFGADSAIEVISAVGLLWRLRKAGPHAAVSEESAAEKRALYVVAITFFLLAIYISLGSRKVAHQSGGAADIPIGIMLAVLSLAVMPALAFSKQRVGKEMGSHALVAESKETPAGRWQPARRRSCRPSKRETCWGPHEVARLTTMVASRCFQLRA